MLIINDTPGTAELGIYTHLVEKTQFAYIAQITFKYDREQPLLKNNVHKSVDLEKIPHSSFSVLEIDRIIHMTE
jgi:hypothetical protein